MSSKPQPAVTPKKKPADKPRDDWYYRRSTFPLRDSAPTELEDFWENQEKFPRAANVIWKESGPANYAGRVTSLAVDPANPSHVLAGSAGGGLWRTHDRGLTWESIWPKFVNQNIGAVAFAPGNNNFIICATGEGNISAAGYPGSGVYCSIDQGLTWQSYIVTPKGDAVDSGQRDHLPRRIACVAFGPGDGVGNFPMAFGSSTKDPSLHAGLYMTFGGQGFKFVTAPGNRSYNCYSVVFHPTDPKIVYASFEPRGALNGIWRSYDAGHTWERLTAKNNLPPGEDCSRISLAISRSDPKTLYALVAPRRGVDGVIGVFRTRDGGDTWTNTGSDALRAERQPNYNSIVAIHPQDPEYAVCGATNLHLTRDGGATWNRITTGERDFVNKTTGKTEVPPNFVHYDHHAVEILPGGWIYSGNDGGFAVSQDHGATWTERSAGMVTTMFYDLDVAPSNSSVFGGGAQDAGSVISGVRPDGSLAPPGADPRQYVRVLPGDGGWMVFAQDDARRVMGSSGSTLYRHAPGAPFSSGLNLATFNQADTTHDDLRGWTLLQKSLSLPRPESKLRAFTILAVQPPIGDSPQQLWLATNRLRRSSNFGLTWRIASHNFDGSAISALEFSAKDPRLIFVGTSDGAIFRSTTNGRTWSGNLAGPQIPRRLITQIEVHPDDTNTVIVTTASTGVRAATLNAENAPFGHVFRSRDGGETWQDIDNGALPNVVYNGLAYETHSPYRIFVGGDAGIWAYQNERWISITGTLPNVIVSDLIYHSDRILTAATYGRGIWRLPIPDGQDFPLEPEFQPDNELFPPIPAAGLIYDSLIDPPQPLPDATGIAWSPVPGAVAYLFKYTEANGYTTSFGCLEAAVVLPSYVKGPTAWRVWAILHHSRCSRPSAITTVTL